MFKIFRLMKALPNGTEKNRERPLGMPYAVKARILIYAHLNRMPLENAGLEEDQRYFSNISCCFFQSWMNISTFLTPSFLDTYWLEWSVWSRRWWAAPNHSLSILPYVLILHVWILFLFLILEKNPARNVWETNSSAADVRAGPVAQGQPSVATATHRWI